MNRTLLNLLCLMVFLLVACGETKPTPTSGASSVKARHVVPEEALAHLRQAVLMGSGTGKCPEDEPECVEKALNEIEESLRIDPLFAYAYVKRGNIFSGQGRYLRAVQEYDEAIRLDPQDAFAYHRRAEAHEYMGQTTQALNDYDQAIRLDPERLRAYIDRGDLYYDLGQYELALHNYNEAIFLQDADVFGFTWYIRRAEAYTMLNMSAEADRDIQAHVKRYSIPDDREEALTEWLTGLRNHLRALMAGRTIRFHKQKRQ